MSINNPYNFDPDVVVSKSVMALIKKFKLTSRQKEILEFIINYTEMKGCSPSIREISEKFNFNSPNGALDHIKALERKGYIKRESKISRGIKVLRNTRYNSVKYKLVEVDK